MSNRLKKSFFFFGQLEQPSSEVGEGDIVGNSAWWFSLSLLLFLPISSYLASPG